MSEQSDRIDRLIVKDDLVGLTPEVEGILHDLLLQERIDFQVENERLKREQISDLSEKSIMSADLTAAQARIVELEGGAKSVIEDAEPHFIYDSLGDKYDRTDDFRVSGKLMISLCAICPGTELMGLAEIEDQG